MKKLFIIIALFWNQINTAQTTLGTYFTYQGELVVNGQSITGSYDFLVNVYNASTGGVNIGGQAISNVTVTNGLFTLTIDIGDIAFVGDERWLQLSVRTVSGPTFTDLLPRQLITNAPYAIHAQFVGSNGVNEFAIENGSVTTAKIEDAAVTATKLAANSVTSAKIANGTIATADIASQAVTRTQIAANTIQRSEVDSTQIQERVTGTCAAGSSIRVIAQDGTVTCETDDTGGSSGWGLTGNAGTNPATDFIGTSDNTGLSMKVNNIDAINLIPTAHPVINAPNAIIASTSNSSILNTSTSASVIIAGNNNKIAPNVSTEGLALIGGELNSIKSSMGSGLNLSNSTILGGLSNTIEDSSRAAIIGGSDNKVSGLSSVVLGGSNNTITRNNSIILAGLSNSINAEFSVAGGASASVNHKGSFVWSDAAAGLGMSTSAQNQFLIQATGGVGIGTNAPASPLHIKGQGTTFGTVLTEVVMTVEPKTTTDDVSLAINRLASNKEAALLFTTSQAPDFDIRSVNGQALDFTNYDNLGSPRLMMRINDGVTQRIDVNANLEPWTDGVYNLGGISGGSEFRWATLYTVNVDTTNAVNVTSDRRLKDNIKEMDYGLAEILSMNPVTYSMKNDAKKHKHMGLIAQEVETIIPEIVNQKEDEMHTRSMRYGELIPVLIKATQEQQTLIEQQAQQIKDLKSLVNDLLSNKKTNK